MKKLTIVDIAQMAGVGTTTVSRYFNGGNLKKETRERIKEIVDKYNYTPNTFAKALKSTDSKIIGVIVPCLHSYISGNTLKYLETVVVPTPAIFAISTIVNFFIDYLLKSHS